jgi:hypothetical protein
VRWPPAWDTVEDWQLSQVLQRRLRKDGAIFELTVDKSPFAGQ